MRTCFSNSLSSRAPGPICCGHVSVGTGWGRQKKKAGPNPRNLRLPHFHLVGVRTRSRQSAAPVAPPHRSLRLPPSLAAPALLLCPPSRFPASALPVSVPVWARVVRAPAGSPSFLVLALACTARRPYPRWFAGAAAAERSPGCFRGWRAVFAGFYFPTVPPPCPSRCSLQEPRCHLLFTAAVHPPQIWYVGLPPYVLLFVPLLLLLIHAPALCIHVSQHLISVQCYAYLVS